MTERLSFRPERRPNVIWIFGDQHRAHALSYRGDPNVFTPNIDNLAREGTRFDCAVAGAPWCSPFRGALLTGTYPHQNGVTKTPSPLRPTIPTIAEPFNDAGYHTAYIGKWHLDGRTHGNTTCRPSAGGSFSIGWGMKTTTTRTSAMSMARMAKRPGGWTSTKPMA